MGTVVGLFETREKVVAAVEALKAAGFAWATRSGVTISITDVVTPKKIHNRKRNIR